MLGQWTELLPLFMVRYLAKRYAEKIPIDSRTNTVAAQARPDVLIVVPRK